MKSAGRMPPSATLVMSGRAGFPAAATAVAPQEPAAPAPPSRAKTAARPAPVSRERKRVNEFVIRDGYERAGVKFLTLPGYLEEITALLSSAQSGHHVYVRAV